VLPELPLVRTEEKQFDSDSGKLAGKVERIGSDARRFLPDRPTVEQYTHLAQRGLPSSRFGGRTTRSQRRRSVKRAKRAPAEPGCQSREKHDADSPVEPGCPVARGV
jgi:hypothetical protein